jgi:hypothetical protein
MTTAKKDPLKRALRLLIVPFLEQKTETLFFSRNEAASRYYIGVVPATNDSSTEQAPRHQCRQGCAGLLDDAALDDVLASLETPTDETFPRVALPDATWIAVVLHLMQKRVVASVRSGGKIRTIHYHWKEKDATIVPPDSWGENVLGECKFQDELPPPGPRALFRHAKGKR